MSKAFKIAQAAKIAVVVIGVLLAIKSLAGCSESITRSEYEVPTLEQVRRDFAGSTATRDSVDGINFEFYRRPGSGELAVAAFVRPDSCLVISLDEYGEIELPSGMKANFWKCVARGIQLCNQIHGEPQDPEGIERKNRCLATSLTSCYIAYGLFGWLCE